MLDLKVQIISSLLLLIIATASAEPPRRRRPAPYPAAGFRPKRPFNLPGEYLPPASSDIEIEEPETVIVGIEKQRIDFAGQTVERQPIETRPPKQVNGQRYQPDYFNFNALPNKYQPVNFRPQITEEQTTNPQFLPTTPTTTSTISVNNPNAQFFPNEQNFGQPATTYGAPGAAYPDPRNAGGIDAEADVPDAADTEQQNREAIEALKLALQAYNRAQAQDFNENADDRNTSNAAEDDGGIPTALFSRGQYFILGPDNTVQRVMFTTTQTDEEATKMGFTAELKYTPVGEIRDPVFKYNNEGQLVRVF